MKKQRPRTCVGCGEISPKRELIRIIRTPEGEVRYDATGKANGRGAYVCKCRECVELAKKKRSLPRALKCDVSDDIFDELLALCAGAEAQ